MSYQFETEYFTSTIYESFDNSKPDKNTGIAIFNLFSDITHKLTDEKMYPIKITDPQIIVNERIQNGNEVFEKGMVYMSFLAIPMADYPMFNGNMKNFDNFFGN